VSATVFVRFNKSNETHRRLLRQCTVTLRWNSITALENGRKQIYCLIWFYMLLSLLKVLKP